MSLRRFVPLLSLSVVTLVLWCAVTDRWSLEAWRTPLQLNGDPLEIYARVKLAAEDLTQPLRGYAELPRFGAPVGADWRRYPISDRLVFTALGVLARVAGVFAAVNLAIAAVHLLNALAFYLCARFLRWRWPWAFALALLFSFSNYNFRWGVTVSFSLTFVIPPLLLLCGWIARGAPAVRPRAWTLLAAVLGLWFGGANPYLGFFAAPFVGWSVLLQLMRRREFARWRAGAIFLCVLGASFLLHNASYFFAPTEGMSGLTLSRNYAGSEIYALKITDLVVPPAEHHVPVFAKLGRAYAAQSAFRGEFFVNYLGVFGLAGLVLLVLVSLHRLATRSRGRVPDAALGLAWAVLFAMPGGVNSLLALGGFDLFRASNRVSIFVLVWALWFFGRWAQRLSWPTIPWLAYALPLLVATAGLYDSIPRLRTSAALRDNAAALAAMRETTAALETRLGPNALIFQVPTPPFPEAGTFVRLPDYEHFLPFLTSHTLRFSYGALRGTPLSRGLRSLARVPAETMKNELEALGFHAVWVDRRGLPDGDEKLTDTFTELGLEEFPQTSVPHVAIFLLNPSPSPRRLDLTDPRIFEPWDIIRTITQPHLAIYEGWYPLESDGTRSWRWAENTATTGIAMPRDGIIQLSYWARSLSRGELVLELDGREISRHVTSPKSHDQRVVRFKLARGRHRLVWHFTGPLEHPASADARKLGFAIENLALSEVNPPPSPRSR